MSARRSPSVDILRIARGRSAGHDPQLAPIVDRCGVGRTA